MIVRNASGSPRLSPKVKVYSKPRAQDSCARAWQCWEDHYLEAVGRWRHKYNHTNTGRDTTCTACAPRRLRRSVLICLQVRSSACVEADASRSKGKVNHTKNYTTIGNFQNKCRASTLRLCLQRDSSWLYGILVASRSLHCLGPF